MKLPKMLYDLTGSDKFKMAASKTGKPLFQLVDRIKTKFQRLNHVFEVQQSNGTISIVRPNRKYEIPNLVVQTGSTYTSACRQDRNEIPMAKTMFSRFSNPMGLSVYQYQYQTWSMTTKMVSFKPEVPISQLVNNIETKYSNGYTYVFGVGQHGETSDNTVRCLGMSKIEDGGPWPEVEMT